MVLGLRLMIQELRNIYGNTMEMVNNMKSSAEEKG